MNDNICGICYDHIIETQNILKCSKCNEGIFHYLCINKTNNIKCCICNTIIKDKKLYISQTHIYLLKQNKIIIDDNYILKILDLYKNI